MRNDLLKDKSAKIHPFANETVYFANQHKKEEILAPLFSQIDMLCTKIHVDTDKFGTFSGEIDRVGSVRDNLRKKIKEASKIEPSVRFIMSSEGSFGPHPFLGFMQSDLESLLIWDREYNTEIYAEYLCTKPVDNRKELDQNSDLQSILNNLGFPDHGVIVHPQNFLTPIFKGLHNELDVTKALNECLRVSKNGRAVIENDLRACHNPTRRNAILQAGKALIDKLKSLCPSCCYPGYSIIKGIPGLPCLTCGEPSQITKSVLYECVKCDFSEEKTRPDEKKFIDTSECEFCNP